MEKDTPNFIKCLLHKIYFVDRVTLKNLKDFIEVNIRVILKIFKR